MEILVKDLKSNQVICIDDINPYTNTIKKLMVKIISIEKYNNGFLLKYKNGSVFYNENDSLTLANGE